VRDCGARGRRDDQELITMTHVVGFDETTLRCGPAGQKKYVLSASTENATVYHLGGRDLDSFAEAGILPEFAGVGRARPLPQLLPSPLGEPGGASSL
jgi:hypothetical protein